MERQGFSVKARIAGALFALLAGCLAHGWACGNFTLFGDGGGGGDALVGASLGVNPTSANACSVETVTCTATPQMDPSAASTEGLTYTWNLDLSGASGSSASLAGSSTANNSFKPDVAGSYKVTVTVADENGNTYSDEETVTASSDPIAVAGEDQQVDPGATVTLDGSGSMNPADGLCDTTGLTFLWEIISSPDPNEPPAISDPAAVQPTFVADLEGEYEVQLTVSVAGGASDTDTITVGVQPTIGDLDPGVYDLTVTDVGNTMLSDNIATDLMGQESSMIVPDPTTGTTFESSIALEYTDIPFGTVNLDLSWTSTLDEEYAVSGDVSVSYSTCTGGATVSSGGSLSPLSSTEAMLTFTVTGLDFTGDPADVALCRGLVCKQQDCSGTTVITMAGQKQ